MLGSVSTFGAEVTLEKQAIGANPGILDSRTIELPPYLACVTGFSAINFIYFSSRWICLFLVHETVFDTLCLLSFGLDILINVDKTFELLQILVHFLQS